MCYDEDEMIKQWKRLVAQRGGGCSIPQNSQGQVGSGFEQSDTLEDVSAQCRVF